MQVITEKKISGTRMREIARNAGISTGTLHYHFPTKEKLLQSLLDEMELDPPGKLSWFLDQEKQRLIDRRELAEVFVDFWGHGLKAPQIKSQIQRMYERWRDDIQAALKEGTISDQNDLSKIALVASLMLSLMEGAALQYLIDDSGFDL